MKKGIILILLAVLLVFVFINTKIVSAFTFGGFFGGKIIGIEAVDVQELEDFGYDCIVPGYSIEIQPIGSPAGTPTSYLIPSDVDSKTGTIPRVGQFILGRYSGQTTVECFQATADGSGYDTQTVILSTIDLFGTSR